MKDGRDRLGWKLPPPQPGNVYLPPDKVWPLPLHPLDEDEHEDKDDLMPPATARGF